MSDDVNVKKNPVMDDVELKEWLASLDYVLNSGTSDRVQYLLQQLQIRAQESGVTLPFTYNTPYINTISKDKAAAFSRQPRIGTPYQIHYPLECHGHGGAGQ